MVGMDPGTAAVNGAGKRLRIATYNVHKCVGMDLRVMPERIAEVAESATGQYLKPMLERASVKPVVVESKPRKRSRKADADADQPDLMGAK